MNPGCDLEAAYRATAYTAETPDGPLALRIGEASAALDCLLAVRGLTSWAYVTAYNPGSIPLSDAENERRQRELRAAVVQSDHPFYEGAGVGEGWPPEPSLLVLGMDEAEATALARRFGQLAVVVGERGGPARLLWTNTPRPR
jgi:Protein of unknown function (DUF3293)